MQMSIKSRFLTFEHANVESCFHRNVALRREVDGSNRGPRRWVKE